MDGMQAYVFRYLSPLGGITLTSDGAALTGLRFDGQRDFGYGAEGFAEEKMLPVFEETARWLDTYFGGNIPAFTPALSIRATPFRETVWNMLLSIPYGATTTYGELAERIAKRYGIAKMSAQAVGGAVGRNPISLIIPCHRVIGADGSLTGYGGGLDKKAELLALERTGIITDRNERRN